MNTHTIKDRKIDDERLGLIHKYGTERLEIESQAGIARIIDSMGKLCALLLVLSESAEIAAETFANLQFPEKMHHVKWIAPRARRVNDRI